MALILKYNVDRTSQFKVRFMRNPTVHAGVRDNGAKVLVGRYIVNHVTRLRVITIPEPGCLM